MKLEIQTLTNEKITANIDQKTFKAALIKLYEGGIFLGNDIHYPPHSIIKVTLLKEKELRSWMMDDPTIFI